jgi:guanine deaminase
MPQSVKLIAGGRVYRHQGDTARPAEADVSIEAGRIVEVAPGLAQARAGRLAPGELVDARDRLLLPGFVNAHYHSHDVLLKGMFEPLPLNLWMLNALPPMYPPRSLEELRARTLLGAVECLGTGITTVQDMVTLFPLAEPQLDAVLDAYEAVGIRAVLALQFGDLRALDRVPYWRQEVPEALHDKLGAAVPPGGGGRVLEFVEAVYLSQRGRRPRLGWALGPTGPAMASPALLEGVAALARKHGLPVFSHLYETRSEAVMSRAQLKAHGGSEVRYLKATGLLGPALTLAHAIWLDEAEIDLVAEAGAGVALCPAGNLKTKSGVAPIRDYRARGVNIALGSDNCSCNDSQNLFQAMKLCCGLAAVSDPEPDGPTAEEALRYATLGGARALGLAGEVGAIEPGHRADLTLLDLSAPTLVPLNHAARQAVYAENGAAVDKVIVDGRLLVDGGRVLSVDLDELRQAAEVAAEALRLDHAAVAERFAQLRPHVLQAWRRSWSDDVGVHRYVGMARPGQRL